MRGFSQVPLTLIRGVAILSMAGQGRRACWNQGQSSLDNRPVFCDWPIEVVSACGCGFLPL
jgi:hypothetical protein